MNGWNQTPKRLPEVQVREKTSPLLIFDKKKLITNSTLQIDNNPKVYLKYTSAINIINQPPEMWVPFQNRSHSERANGNCIDFWNWKHFFWSIPKKYIHIGLLLVTVNGQCINSHKYSSQNKGKHQDFIEICLWK